MKRFTLQEDYKTIEDTVQELLGSDDPVLYVFDVLPLDYDVKDILTSKLFLSQTRLVFVLDSLVELYDLKDIRVWSFGGEPNFTLTQQSLEFVLDVTEKKAPYSKHVDFPDEWIRVALVEGNSSPKVFVLRKENRSLKGYQSWAFSQIIKNMQRGEDDFQLRNMVHGNFSFFDGYFLIVGFLIFLAYVFISIVFGGIMPDFLRNMIDALFGVICIIIVGWIFWTIFVNVRRYRLIFERYKARAFKEASLRK